MKPEIVIEVVDRLIGRVNSVGESTEDKNRLENLKSMCVLTSYLIEKIRTASESKENYQHSMKVIGLYAENFLKEEGLK